MDYEGLVPKFKSSEEALKFLHIPKRRVCLKCKCKKEKNSNAFYCNKCLDNFKKKNKELKASQAFYAKHPDLIPDNIKKLLA